MTAAIKKKRRIKRSAGKSVFYFDKSTEEAITEFLAIEGSRERELIYSNRIRPAILKLAESLIYVYDFKSPLMSKSELIEECSFSLYNSLHKWNPDRGTKAFSYFNVVAKNFLINTVNSHRKKYFRHVYLNDVENLGCNIQAQITSFVEIPSTEEIILSQECRTALVDRVKHIKSHLTKQQDLTVMAAVENLFDVAEDLDFINKQSIYVYLVEMTGFEKKLVVKSMSKIRKIYAQILLKEVKDERVKQ